MHIEDTMQFVAKARYIWYSPYKLRLVADVVRGKGVGYALGWLTTYKTKRSLPIKKAIESAVANAKSLKNVAPDALIVKEIRVDHGPTHRYYKPGAMGRAMIQRKRLSHISVILESND
jgi:large subunit ribosomal protein L22